jgi:hypothetical protein
VRVTVRKRVRAQHCGAGGAGLWRGGEVSAPLLLRGAEEQARRAVVRAGAASSACALSGGLRDVRAPRVSAGAGAARRTEQAGVCRVRAAARAYLLRRSSSHGRAARRGNDAAGFTRGPAAAGPSPHTRAVRGHVARARGHARVRRRSCTHNALALAAASVSV